MANVRIRIAEQYFELASRTQRLCAFLIDALILFVATLILHRVLGALGIRPGHPNIFQIATLLLWLFGLSFMEGFNGRGPGKAIMQLRVLRLKDGRPSNFTDAFFRRLTMILLPLDLLWTLGEKRQRIGDTLTKTVVVKSKATRDIEFATEAPEAPIQIAGNDFELGEQLARLYALLVDVLLLLFATFILLLFTNFISYVLRLAAPEYYIYMAQTFDPSVIETFSIVPKISIIRAVFYILTIGLWIFGVLFMDGFNGRSPGKNLMQLRVFRLKDGKPCTLKNAFLRRITIILLIVDLIPIFRQKRQRLGDKLAGTVVVKFNPKTAAAPVPSISDRLRKIMGTDFELGEQSGSSPENSIRIAGKTFELGEQLARLFAFVVDVLALSVLTLTLYLLSVSIIGCYLDYHAYRVRYFEDDRALTEITSIEFPIFLIFYILTIGLWIFGLFFTDGFNGRSLGKRVIGLQVLRLKDGKPCTLKNAFLRRITIILPFTFGQKRQRLGDKLTGTVVVKAPIGQVVPDIEPSIQIRRKDFELAPLKLRVPAVLIDAVFLFNINFLVALIIYTESPLFSIIPWGTFQLMSLGFGILGLFFLDGFKGYGPGKRVMSIQIIRLKDGKPGNFKDSFLRRLASVLQLLDFIRGIRQKRKQLGIRDKIAGTVVVKTEPTVVIVDPEVETYPTEDPEKVLDEAIAEMKGRLSKASQQVNASIEVEKQFQQSYAAAASQAEQAHAQAVSALQAEDEDTARQALKQRNKHRQLAEGYKKQREAQKQAVESLNNTLAYLQHKIMEAQVNKTVIVAQDRNTKAEALLRKILTEIEESEPVKTIIKMEQRVTEEATLERAMAEVDKVHQGAESGGEFATYATETEIDKELADLKAKLR